jgi:hypothetical protein
MPPRIATAMITTSQIQTLSESSANCAGGAGWNTEAIVTPEPWLLQVCLACQSCKDSLKPGF